MKSISERLTHARELKGWSKSKLAIASGLTPSAIGNIESGIRQARASLLPIAKALEINYEWLANGVGAMKPTTTHYDLLAEAPTFALPTRKPEDEFSPLATLLARMFDKIPEDDLLGRSQAFNAASIEIRAVLDAKHPAPAVFGKTAQ
jgi:transcriptional regulator with XRE-family HTH domain